MLTVAKWIFGWALLAVGIFFIDATIPMDLPLGIFSPIFMLISLYQLYFAIAIAVVSVYLVHTVQFELTHVVRSLLVALALVATFALPQVVGLTGEFSFLTACFDEGASAFGGQCQQLLARIGGVATMALQWLLFTTALPVLVMTAVVHAALGLIDRLLLSPTVET
ncbi:MAG: hypothetical protein AAF590_02395 [Pseudomonadota bacterium]